MIILADAIIKDEGVKAPFEEGKGDRLPLSFMADHGVATAGDNEHSRTNFIPLMLIGINPHTIVRRVKKYSGYCHKSPRVSFLPILYILIIKKARGMEILTPSFS